MTPKKSPDVIEYADDDVTLRMMSGQGKEVLVVLPNDSAFLNELRSALKIEKYLRLTTSNKLAKFEQIKEAKRIEMRERNGNAKLFLQESMKNAAIYVNGDRAQIGAKEVSSRINDALGRLVEARTTGTPNDGVKVSTTYDAADNRTTYVVTGSKNKVVVVPLNGLSVIVIPDN